MLSPPEFLAAVEGSTGQGDANRNCGDSGTWVGRLGSLLLSGAQESALSAMQALSCSVPQMHEGPMTGLGLYGGHY